MNYAELHQFTRPELLELALTHKSYGNENGDRQGSATHNERLEFLGDAVLGAVLSSVLMQEFPADTEGQLSRRRASLVNEESLAAIALGLGLNEAIKLGKGEVKTGGREKPRILACAVEALIGAVHQDGGYSAVERVVDVLFRTHIEQLRTSSSDYERDYKTRFQEWAHEQRSASPVYELAEEFGPAHARCFRVVARLTGEIVGQGEGRSKKAAEQDAAQKALAHLLASDAKTDQGDEPNAPAASPGPESQTHDSQSNAKFLTTDAGSSGLTTSHTRKETL